MTEITIALAKNNIDWFTRLAASHQNAVERYTRLANEATEAARMWEDTLALLQDQQPTN